MKWTAAHVPDQSGRVAVITGANTGIGLEAAAVLAGKGAQVVMAVRDLDKGRDAASRITDANPRAHITMQRLDLSSLTSVQATAAEIKAAYPRIDLLINNAGVMFTPEGVTPDGIEFQFGTNHLGHFALTGLLLDGILQVDGSRVVTISSLGHRMRASTDFGDVQRPYDRMAAYGRSMRRGGAVRSAVAGYLSGSALRRRLLSGSTWALGGKIGAAAIGVVTNGVLAHMLSKQEFGEYLLAFSIIAVGAVVGSLGLPKTVLRFVAESMTLEKPGRARRAIYTALALGLAGALITSLAYYFVVGDLVGKYLFHSPALVAVIGLTTGWMAISALQEIIAEAFRGFHDIRMATLFGGLATGGKSAGLIMRALLLICLLLLWATSGHTDLRTVMLVSVGSGAASALLSFLFLRKRVSPLGTRGAEDSISAREALHDAFPILIISLTSFILLSAADLWILGVFGSKDDVALYGAASRLVTLIAMPLLITNLVLPPIIAEMYAQGRTGQLERTLRSFSTLSGVPSMLFLAVFMVLGAPIMGFVYGNGYRSAAIILVLLSAGKLAAVWAGSCGAVLQFTGNQGSMLRINLLTSPLFVVGALLVVRDYGPIGVASMTAAITVVQNAALVLVAKRKTGMWTHVSLSPSRLRNGLSKR